MNSPDIDIRELFCKHYSNLDEETILKINKNNVSGDLNNVVVGLKKHCYGISLISDVKEVRYRLFYVNGKNKLEGDYIQLSLDTKYKDYIIFFFSNFLAHNYDDLDPIDTFNTFQSQTRSMLEKIGYLTVSNIEFEKFEDPVLFAPWARGIIKINYVEKLNFYKDLFANTQYPQSAEESDYVYLMLNKRNHCIKIGKSKNPDFREKTLQADEPEVELITFWKAPSEKERELHKMFSKDRKRGEWFKLKLKDLKAIKEFMKEYEAIGSHC
jgi:uncharacterized protein YutE (UPF0331/DUF86 family)